MQRQLLFYGGNGHSAARLALARLALAELAQQGGIEDFDLVNVPYPGFENRPRAKDLDAFLDALSTVIAGRSAKPMVLYGTGIGGLLVLCLRARGEWLDVPVLLQAPVLWGLERRWMPRILRLGPVRFALHRLFAFSWFQSRFVRQQFERPLAPTLRKAFFQGYADCPAAADFFAWLTPALLRRLENQFAGRPQALEGITVWWGRRDRVVNLQELAWTEQALGVRWPVRIFPTWGHYPMIDEPHDWVREVSHALAAPEAFSGYHSPEAE
jgi:pimeloyl-ACP methyl ester carboxylesterase